MPQTARGADSALTKVPEVTLVFWIIKIAATTLGETGGDSVTMTLHWGYLDGTALFAGILIALVGAQIVAKNFHPFLYWATIVASTTFGTTMADFADRSLGIGYTGGSTLLLACLLAVLALWYWSQGSISVETVITPRVEVFYWAAITFSQTLGTALGDWIADTGGLGYEGGALVFGAGLAVLAAAYYWTGPVARRAVLGRLHSHPAAGRDRRRFPRQAGRATAGWRSSRPLASAVIAVFHRRLHSAAAAARRHASGAGESGVISGRAMQKRDAKIGGGPAVFSAEPPFDVSAGL